MLNFQTGEKHNKLLKTNLDLHPPFFTSPSEPEPELPVKMRLALQTVICCCVFTAVLPLVRGASGELNTSLKKRLKVFVPSRVRRGLQDGVVISEELCADILSRLQQDAEGGATPAPSPGLVIRRRRSTSSKAIGCVLITCSYHDLLFRLHQITNNKQKDANAPENKIGSNGYGRRRRSLLDVVQPAVQAGGQKGKKEAFPRSRPSKVTHTAA